MQLFTICNLPKIHTIFCHLAQKQSNRHRKTRRGGGSPTPAEISPSNPVGADLRVRPFWNGTQAVPYYVIPRPVRKLVVGIRFLVGITDCHVAALLAMTVFPSPMSNITKKQTPEGVCFCIRG